ncbi:putative T7SS-secreted protein [Streptomyces xiamenensis]|uniref:putative T7SS-secreted protein n=1 Tax=Streptomyces xiamenensis TaxID=408015 RepID=UPI00367A9ABC
MSRSSAGGDWSLVGESSDPIPGDPEEVATLGRELRQMADAIQQQAGEIEALASVENWNTPTAEQFREKADGVSGRLRKAFDRYDTAARALGTEVKDFGEDYEDHTEYASELHRAQLKADRALSDAEDADQDLRTATNALDALDDDIEDDDPDKTRLEGNQETAENALSSARSLISTAKEIRNTAAEVAAGAIREVINNDGMKDSGWDKFRYYLDKVATVLGVVAAIIGVIALIIGIFVSGGALLAVLGWVAFAFTAVSFANNAIKLAHGEGSWLDLTLDAIGLLTFGIGSIAAKAIKPAAQGVAATARRAFTGLARRSGNVRQWMQNAGIGSNSLGSSGARLGQAIRGMPPRMFPSIPMPSSVTGVMSWAPRIMDSDIRNLTSTLAAMGPDVVSHPAVRGAIQNFNSQSITWATSTLAGTSAGVIAGDRSWDAFTDVVGW